jgi:hypothetical protein
MKFELSIYRPLSASGLLQPITSQEFDTHETSFRLGCQIEVGHAVCQVGIPPQHGQPYTGPLVRPFGGLPKLAHCVVRYGGLDIFTGYLAGVSRGPGGQIMGITIFGYAAELKKRHVTFDDDTTEYSSGNLVRLILDRYASFISVAGSDNWHDPGVVHLATDVGDGRMTAAQAIDQLTREGGVDAYQYDFQVWHRMAHLVRRRAPRDSNDQPRGDLVMPFDERITRWEEDEDGMVTHVSVRYQLVTDGTEATTDVRTNTGLLSSLGGRIREAILEGGELSANGANAFRDTYAAKHSEPIISGAITAQQSLAEYAPEPGAGIEQWGGGERPLFLVRPGEWVKVEGHSPQVLLTTQFASDTGEFSATFGEPDITADLFRYVGLLWTHGRSRINLVTGGKDRAL